MAKDRLPELLKSSGSQLFRSQSYSENNYINNLSAMEVQRIANIDSLLNQYGEIRIMLATITSNLEAMSRMTQTANITNFNENELDALRNENLKFGQNLMTIFNRLKLNLPQDNDFVIESRMKRCLFHGLHRTYINVWNKNEAFLLSYETKLKKHLQLHAKILNYNKTEEEVEDMITNKTTSMFVDNILEQTENERRKLRDLMERYSELKKLERSIEDVHALFIRIQNLVIEQSELIQVIEHHAMQASLQVDKGADQLDQAHILRKKTLKKKTCLIAFGISVLIILIIFLFVF